MLIGPRPRLWKTPANLLIPLLSLERPSAPLCVGVISRRCIGRPAVTSMTGNASLTAAFPLVTKLLPLDAWARLGIAKPSYHSATLKLLILVINSIISLTGLSRDFTQHPHNYQYCPTAGCDQVYGISDEDKLFTCFTCLTSVCFRRGAVSHDGLKCEQNKKAVLSDDAFVE